MKDESLELPPLLTGGNRAEMVKQSKEDKSVEAWRKLAGKYTKGYKWKNGYLIHATLQKIIVKTTVLVHLTLLKYGLKQTTSRQNNFDGLI